MAAGVNRKISAASARAYTRKTKQKTPIQLPSGMFMKIQLVFFVGFLAWGYQAQIRQLGEYESLHRDLMIGFGTWEFDPMELKKQFPNNEGSVQLWHDDEDNIVPVTLQGYIAQRLPYIHYHELAGSGHMFPFADGMGNAIIKALLIGENTVR